MQISTNAIASRYSNIDLTSLQRPSPISRRSVTYTQAGRNTKYSISRYVERCNHKMPFRTNYFS